VGGIAAAHQVDGHVEVPMACHVTEATRVAG